MKLLLLVILFATGTSLNAQRAIADKAMLYQRAMLYKTTGKDTLKQRPFNMVIVPSRRVRILPQDGMPCIVPDTKDIASMPNAWSGEKVAANAPLPGQIPNAWKPLEEEITK